MSIIITFSMISAHFFPFTEICPLCFNELCPLFPMIYSMSIILCQWSIHIFSVKNMPIIFTEISSSLCQWSIFRLLFPLKYDYYLFTESMITYFYWNMLSEVHVYAHYFFFSEVYAHYFFFQWSMPIIFFSVKYAHYFFFQWSMLIIFFSEVCPLPGVLHQLCHHQY